MSILYWNVQGAGNPAFLRNVNDMVDRFNPSILVFSETHVNRQRAEVIIRHVQRGFDNCPTFQHRKLLWENLTAVSATSSLFNLPWLLAGDFNEKLTNDDKRGGNPISQHKANLLQNCLDAYNLLDLGFNGPKFTWSNMRSILNLIQARLDRAFANPS
ncbi:hypothetical protein SLA2020_087660 [Shorea laevis]